MLTQQELRERFEYRDGNLYRRRAAQKYPAGSMVGSIASGGTSRPDKKYLVTSVKGVSYSVHRLIFAYHHGFFPQQVDHINRDTLDNRIENLRPADQSKNMCNRRKFANNTSGYCGVHWSKRQHKWVAYVDIDKRRHHLGCFDDAELAGLVASEARDKYHGEFAAV